MLILILQKTKFHVSHSLDYRNGYAIRKRPEVTVGGMPLPFNNLSERELEALANFKPTLTYGQAKQAPPEDFLPAHVAWDKKVPQLLLSVYFESLAMTVQHAADSMVDQQNSRFEQMYS